MQRDAPRYKMTTYGKAIVTEILKICCTVTGEQSVTLAML